MIYQRVCGVFNPIYSAVQTRNIQTTVVVPLIQKWRKDRGLPMNPYHAGDLLGKADYSFVDGRPTPYTVGQAKRIMRDRENLKQIIELSAEIDFAVDRHQQLLAAEENRVQQILGNKLKPKGLNLLKSK
ncbi:unnamed protein product [Phaedon cochleariae]|uniref:Large ribosomal subunit protein mL52 n=1 Tax=Phaedon cochleariae TaxID=80249 RepID=A0A9P0GR84_PHACE|nr:unnamed protein product [Phaedon cochleariae]